MIGIVDSPRWLIEIPEDGSVCFLGVVCKLWDRWYDPPKVVFEGPLTACQERLAELESGGAYP